MDGMTLEKLQVLIEAQTKGFREEINKVQGEVKKMTSNVNNEVNKIKQIFKSLGKFVAALGIGKLLTNSVRSAMKVEGAIQQITRTMGESTNQFLKWAQSNALAFNMSQSDAMQYGAVFSNLVSTFSSGSKQTLQYTTDLLKASSIIASGTGRTMEDVMERIRSGLLGNTEAIEDLGINVNVAMLQSTEAFKRFANGKSWDQLSFQTQQQIRLFGILEQTSNKFGGAVFSNTNSSLQQLVAILKDVALNIGNAFLPIVNVVIPILSNFAMGLRTVTAYIASFMQTLFGYKPKTNAGVPGVTNQVKSLGNKATDTGNKAKKAAKEVNRLLGGFDEINTLSKDNGSDGGDIGSGGGTSSVGGGALDFSNSEILEPDTSGLEAAVNKFKDIFRPVIESFENLKIAVQPLVDNIGKILKWFWDEILVPFGTWTISEVIPAFFNILAGAFKILNPVLESFMRLGSWLWDSFLQPIASWTGGIIVDTLNGLAKVLSNIGDWMNDNQGVVDKITASVIAFFAAWEITKLLGFIGESGGVIQALARISKALFATTAAKIADKFETMALTAMYAKDFVMSIPASIAALANQAKQLLINTGLKIADKAETLALAGMYAKDFVMSVINSTVALVKQAAQFAVNTGLKIADTAAQVAMNVATGAWNIICGIATTVTTALGAAIAFLTSPIGLVILAITALIGIVVLLVKNWDTVKEVASNVWAGIQSTWNSASEWFNTNVTSPIHNFFTGMWNSVKNTTANAWNWILSLFSKGGQIFSGVVGSIADVFKRIVNCIISGINSVISFPFNTINRLLNKIKGVEILGFTPFDGFWGYNPLPVPRIPQLAKGGILDSPTLAMVGEAGKEAVVPLENNTGGLDLLASKLLERMPQGGSNDNSNGDLVIMIDGSVIGKVALNQLRKMQRQGGITLIPT